MDLVSTIRGSEKPPALQGVLLRQGNRDPLMRLNELSTEDVKWSAVGVVVVSAPSSRSFSPGAEFNRRMTFIMLSVILVTDTLDG